MGKRNVIGPAEPMWSVFRRGRQERGMWSDIFLPTIFLPAPPTPSGLAHSPAARSPIPLPKIPLPLPDQDALVEGPVVQIERLESEQGHGPLISADRR
jgi:hypothetical protein